MTRMMGIVVLTIAGMIASAALPAELASRIAMRAAAITVSAQMIAGLVSIALLGFAVLFLTRTRRRGIVGRVLRSARRGREVWQIARDANLAQDSVRSLLRVPNTRARGGRA